ncbi:MAG: stage III sporulation protein AG [Gemmiger sp.]
MVKEKFVQKLQSFFSDEKQRIHFLLCMGMAGLVLLAVSEWLPAKTDGTVPKVPDGAVEDYASLLETRLEQLISEVEGAGQTQVMVTTATGEETIYAVDQSVGMDGNRQQTHVLLGSGGAEGLVETVCQPQILGVAVVCEGGDSAVVQLRVTEIVQALTDVGANHITVAKKANQ